MVLAWSRSLPACITPECVPSEAASIRRSDCELPEEGWGCIVLAKTSPRSGSPWTDDGATRETRGLKHRGQGETRPVPIPPKLIRILKSHMERFGVADDGRLFRGTRGGVVPDSEYARVWRLARDVALTSEQADSPLARRPYDLRHTAASLWLNSGVPRLTLPGVWATAWQCCCACTRTASMARTAR